MPFSSGATASHLECRKNRGNSYYFKLRNHPQAGFYEKSGTRKVNGVDFVTSALSLWLLVKILPGFVCSVDCEGLLTEERPLWSDLALMQCYFRFVRLRRQVETHRSALVMNLFGILFQFEFLLLNSILKYLLYLFSISKQNFYNKL